jgi:hypothetical protein
MNDTLITYRCEKCDISIGGPPGAKATCPKGHKMPPQTKEKENG